MVTGVVVGVVGSVLGFVGVLLGVHQTKKRNALDALGRLVDEVQEERTQLGKLVDKLQRREMAVVNYAWTLRAHIEAGKPPPPPPWPDVLLRGDQA